MWASPNNTEETTRPNSCWSAPLKNASSPTPEKIATSTRLVEAAPSTMRGASSSEISRKVGINL
jgi:hypothetical protein